MMRTIANHLPTTRYVHARNFKHEGAIMGLSYSVATPLSHSSVGLIVLAAGYFVWFIVTVISGE